MDIKNPALKIVAKKSNKIHKTKQNKAGTATSIKKIRIENANVEIIIRQSLNKISALSVDLSKLDFHKKTYFSLFNSKR